MEDDQESIGLRQGAAPQQFEVERLYAIPSFMASLFVCAFLGEILPSMWGIKDIVLVLAAVIMTIATLREIQRYTTRR
jgi:hypothetical protein